MPTLEIAENGAIYLDNRRMLGGKPCGLFVISRKYTVSDKDLKRIIDICNEVMQTERSE